MHSRRQQKLAAVEYGADHGANIVELDVQLRSDGKMVVIHDKTLDRTTDCAGHVKDQTLAYVNACDTEPAGRIRRASGRRWFT
jgi:glycerophosphoryl diester phosphodiesterase